MPRERWTLALSFCRTLHFPLISLLPFTAVSPGAWPLVCAADASPEPCCSELPRLLPGSSTVRHRILTRVHSFGIALRFPFPFQGRFCLLLRVCPALWLFPVSGAVPPCSLHTGWQRRGALGALPESPLLRGDPRAVVFSAFQSC